MNHNYSRRRSRHREPDDNQALFHDPAPNLAGRTVRGTSPTWPITFLCMNIPEHYLLISSIDLSDSFGKRLEVDPLLIGEWAAKVLEFKGDTGSVLAGEDVWGPGNGMRKNSPLGPVSFTAGVLAERLKGRVNGAVHVPVPSEGVRHWRQLAAANNCAK